MEGPVGVFASLVSLVASVIATVIAVLEYRSKRQPARRPTSGGTVYGRAQVPPAGAGSTIPLQPGPLQPGPQPVELRGASPARRVSVTLYVVSAIAALVVLALFLPLGGLSVAIVAVLAVLIVHGLRRAKRR